MSEPAAAAEIPDRVASPRIATLLLGLSMGFTGASGLVNEYVLSTTATYLLGGSIEQFSVTIASMMLAMGVAGWAQRFLPDRALAEQFILVETLLALLAGFAPLACFAVFAVARDHFVLAQFAFVCAIGLLVGLEVPLILRINARYSDSLRTNLAAVLSLDYVGAFAGAMVWTFWLLRAFPITEISFLVAGANFAVAIITFGWFSANRLVRRPVPLLLLAAAVAATLVAGHGQARNWTLAIEQHLYRDPIVLSQTTRFQHMVLTHDTALDETRLYLNGNTQWSSLDEARYHETLVHPAMAMARQRRDVLVLGGGDGLAVRELLKYAELGSVTVVDLDPAMIELARVHPLLSAINHGAFADARVQTRPATGVSTDGWRPVFQADETGKVDKLADVAVLTIDAMAFVQGISNQQWDVVVIDLPDPNSIELAKLYSREFYRALVRLVRPGGVIVTQATSPYHSRDTFLCIRRTMDAAGWATLPLHVNIPSFGDWGFVLARRPGEIVLPVVDTIAVPTRWLTPEVIRAAAVFGKGELSSGRDEVSTLMRPVVYNLYAHEGWKMD